MLKKFQPEGYCRAYFQLLDCAGVILTVRTILLKVLAVLMKMRFGGLGFGLDFHVSITSRTNSEVLGFMLILLSFQVLTVITVSDAT